MTKAGSTKKRRPSGRFAPAMSRVRVVFEDRQVLVAEKPPGLLTASTPRESKRTMFRHLLDREQQRNTNNKLFVVHKLDRDASGLVLFAKQEATRRRLRAQLRECRANRKYRAVVEGHYPRDEETFRSYLAQNAALKVYVTHDVDRGKLAVTHIKVVRRLTGATLIEATQETGCKHQLRVHVATAGHPIVGDRRYGEDRSGPIGRLALHASGLQFEHPNTGELLKFRSPVPARFVDAFKGARGASKGVKGTKGGKGAAKAAKAAKRTKGAKGASTGVKGARGAKGKSPRRRVAGKRARR